MHIRFDGKTVRFEAFGMQWTIVDGGAGYANDKIIVNGLMRARPGQPVTPQEEGKTGGPPAQGAKAPQAPHAAENLGGAQ